MSKEEKAEEIEQQRSPGECADPAAGTETCDGVPPEGDSREKVKDPGVAWATENAEATGAHNAENMRSAGIPGHIVMIISACLVILIALWFYLAKRPEPLPEGAQSGVSGTQDQAQSAETAEAEETAEAAATGEAASVSSTAGTSQETAIPLSPEMEALDKKLREELADKAGDWSLYLYRLDTGEEIGINANDPMISASLIKLYVAGCYLEQVEKGAIEDDYQQQLFSMISASDNGATNQLIDLLGMDQINAFMKDHHYTAGQLNRKMLENNGTENYTSAKDCGRVLRKVYKGTYVNKEASGRILEAMRAQIARNRYKIPAGLPEDVETANKTGELYTKNKEGINVSVQNDAAIIFAEDHPYVLTVMTAVPGIIPLIMLGNAVLVLGVNFLFKPAFTKSKNYFDIKAILMAVLSCAAKGCIMGLTIALWLLPTYIPEASPLRGKMSVFQSMFSITQFVTALIGFVYFYIVWKAVKKIIK